MTMQIIALGLLIGAIAIGFIKKINVGIAAFAELTQQSILKRLLFCKMWLHLEQ